MLIQYCLTSLQRHVSARSVVTASSTGTRRSATGMTSAPPPVPRGVQGRHITQHTFEYHANVTVTINLQRCTVGITNYAFGNRKISLPQHALCCVRVTSLTCIISGQDVHYIDGYYVSLNSWSGRVVCTARCRVSYHRCMRHMPDR